MTSSILRTRPASVKRSQSRPQRSRAPIVTRVLQTFRVKALLSQLRGGYGGSRAHNVALEPLRGGRARRPARRQAGAGPAPCRVRPRHVSSSLDTCPAPRHSMAPSSRDSANVGEFLQCRIAGREAGKAPIHVPAPPRRCPERDAASVQLKPARSCDCTGRGVDTNIYSGTAHARQPGDRRAETRDAAGRGGRARTTARFVPVCSPVPRL